MSTRKRFTALVTSAVGSLTVTEDILEGLEKAPEGLIGVLNGTNVGKRMTHVADPS